MINRKLHSIEGMLDDIIKQLNELHKSVRSLRWWIVGSYLAAGIILVAAMWWQSIRFQEALEDQLKENKRAWQEILDRHDKWWEALKQKYDREIEK